MKRHYFVTSAVVLCLGAAAAAACSNSSTPSPQPGTGSGNAPGAAGSNAQTGGGGAGTAGSGNPAAGNGMVAGNGTGGATGGAPGTAGTGTGGAGGTPGTVACKAGAPAPINGSGLALKATDISAFKYSLPPNGKVTKMAYDPVGKVLVMLDGEGKLFSVDPNVALPTTMSTSPVTTTKPYDSGGYKVPDGYGTGVYFPYRGLAFGPEGALYIMAAKAGGVSIAKGAPPATPGGPRTWTTIVTTSEPFPGGMSDNYNHSFSGMAVSADGKSLFFSSGSRTEHGEPEGGPGDGREYPLSSAIFKVPTDGVTDLKAMDEAGLKTVMFADGTRNAFDMAFNANGDLIATDNGPDMDLPDEVNFIEQGKHYGFPWRFGDVDNPVRNAGFMNTTDKRLRPVYGGFALYKYDDKFPAPPMAFTDPIVNLGPDANYLVADANSMPSKAGANGMAGVTAHRSPLGLSFDTTGALCGEYNKQGFMLSYGPINGGSIGDLGEDLVFISLTKADGKYTMHAKQIASGIKQPMDSVLVGNRLFTIGQSDAGMLFVFVLPTP